MNVCKHFFLIYPFHCSETFLSTKNYDAQRKEEANGEEKEVVTKSIWSVPGWAAAGMRKKTIFTIGE